jgi:hypothetical protein
MYSWGHMQRTLADYMWVSSMCVHKLDTQAVGDRGQLEVCGGGWRRVRAAGGVRERLEACESGWRCAGADGGVRGQLTA